MQQRDVVLDQTPHVGGLRATHKPHSYEIAHNQGYHEDRTDHDPRFGQRNDHMPERLPACGPCIHGRFYQGFVDPHHRVEDRHNHEECVEVHEGEKHAKIAEQQPFKRLFNDAHRDKRGVGDPIAAKKWDPRYHSNDVRGQEWDRTEQKQRDLPCEGTDVKRQIIGDGEADQ